MTLINHDINLDFSTSNIKRTLIKQDTNQTHSLTIKLYDNNGRIKLDSNWQYTISCRKADNTFIVNSNNISVSSNTIYVEITKQMTSCPGTEKCELLIQNGSQTLYSGTFYLYIDENVNYGSVLESTNEYDCLSDTLNQMREYEKNSEKVKNHIQDISTDIDTTYDELTEAVNTTNDLIEKNNVIEANEAVRKTNETNREVNEQKRQTDTAKAVENANDAADNANSKANDIQDKLDSHHFALTEDLQAHNSSSTAHDDMRNLILGLTTRLNGVLDSDDTTLDQLSEIVAYIKNNKSLIDNVTTSKVNVSDIIDSLTSTTTNKPLSAKQGKVIKDLIDALTTAVGNKVDKVSGKGLSTNDLTNELKNAIGKVDWKTVSNWNNATETGFYKLGTNQIGIVMGGDKNSNNINFLQAVFSPDSVKIRGGFSYGGTANWTDWYVINKNVQTDWNETDTSSDAYIKNKPTIPTSLPASDTTSNYSSTGTLPVNGAAVNKALQTLSVAEKGGSGKYIQSISETDGKISAIEATMPTIPMAVRVKGNAESSYRTGDVNITAQNVGALSTSGGEVTGDVIFDKYVGIKAWPNYGEGTAKAWYNANTKTIDFDGGVLNIDLNAASATNADTVDGKHASDLLNYNNLTNRPTIPKYEEGSWSPRHGYTSNGTQYNFANGNYTKIGNIVIASFKLSASASSGTYTVYLDRNSLPWSMIAGNFMFAEVQDVYNGKKYDGKMADIIQSINFGDLPFVKQTSSAPTHFYVGTIMYRI